MKKIGFVLTVCIILAARLQADPPGPSDQPPRIITITINRRLTALLHNTNLRHNKRPTRTGSPELLEIERRISDVDDAPVIDQEIGSQAAERVPQILIPKPSASASRSKSK